MSGLFYTFLIILLVLKDTSSQVCSVRKSENNCVCERVTSEDQSTVITEADCSRTNLQKIPQLLNQDLNLLDLSHNDITSLNEEISSIILGTLILSYNQINSIGDSFFEQIPNLRKLHLDHNQITTISNLRSLKKLTHLDLSYNNIKTLPLNILQPLVKLEFLDLSYNDLSLGQWLSETPQSLSVDLGVNPNISTLILDNIGLKDLHNLYFANYTQLKHLSLADNDFEEIPRVPYTVEYLDLSGSQIQTIQAKYLSYHSLKTLKLDRMKILENIHHYAFYSLTSLEELSIRYCHKLSEFNELVFGALHKNESFALKKLWLSGNALQKLNSTYKYMFQKMDFIDLTDNPWRCDCDLLWLQEFENLYRSDNIQCSSPSLLSSKKLIDLTDQNLPSCYPQKYGKKSHRILIALLVLMVIVLSALVGYLIYYSPSWYGNRSGGLSPHSPYSAARTQEN